MKNLLFTIALVCITGLAFGQLKVVAPNGDVGIGTSTPTDKLSVDGNVSVAGGNSAIIALGKGRSSAGTSVINFEADNAGAWINGLRIQRLANGRSAFVHRGTQPLSFNTFDGSNINFVQGTATVMQIALGGNVGIGVLNPTDALAVAGDITATGTVTWSDARLKENVNSFDLGLEQLLQIQPMSYNYNGNAGINSSINKVGVIAQDFEKIVPTAVVERGYYEERDGKDVLVETYKGVDEKVITYMLVNSIKEQQAMIEALQEQVNALSAGTVPSTSGTVANNTTEFSQKQMVLSNLASKEISKISPNPFSQVARIDFNLQREFTTAVVTVFDVDGQLVNQTALETKIGTVEIEASQLSSGMYTYTIEVDGEIVDTKRFIKE